MFMFSDVLKLLEIHLRNIAEVQTVVFVEVIVQRERCNRALPLRLTWGAPLHRSSEHLMPGFRVVDGVDRNWEQSAQRHAGFCGSPWDPGHVLLCLHLAGTVVKSALTCVSCRPSFSS